MRTVWERQTISPPVANSNVCFMNAHKSIQASTFKWKSQRLFNALKNGKLNFCGIGEPEKDVIAVSGCDVLIDLNSTSTCVMFVVSSVGAQQEVIFRCCFCFLHMRSCPSFIVLLPGWLALPLPAYPRLYCYSRFAHVIVAAKLWSKLRRHLSSVCTVHPGHRAFALTRKLISYLSGLI